MMNFLPLCKAIIQHQRMSKGGYGFGAKNNRKLVGCSKDEILDQYNNVVQSAENTTLTSDFLLKGDRAYGDDCYTGTYTADYKDFSKTEYLFGGTSIERENGKDISVSCDLEITEGTAQVFWRMMILPPHNGFLLTAGRHENLLFMRSDTFPCSDEEKSVLQS